MALVEEGWKEGGGAGIWCVVSTAISSTQEESSIPWCLSCEQGWKRVTGAAGGLVESPYQEAPRLISSTCPHASCLQACVEKARSQVHHLDDKCLQLRVKKGRQGKSRLHVCFRTRAGGSPRRSASAICELLLYLTHSTQRSSHPAFSDLQRLALETL